MEILKHYFNSSVEAYEAAQTDETINDGDVLIIESEKVVGLVGDFPIAVTAWHGELHALEEEDSLESLGFSVESINQAVTAANHYGFPLFGESQLDDVEAGRTRAAVETFASLVEARDVAKKKAWDSLGRYKFEMFGYHSSAWVKLNQLVPKGYRQANPFKEIVLVARSYK